MIGLVARGALVVGVILVYVAGDLLYHNDPTWLRPLVPGALLVVIGFSLLSFSRGNRRR